MTVRVFDQISRVPRQAWDALLQGDDAASPFVRWSWLEALEQTGCAASRTGWLPRYVTLWREDVLIAAAPAYAREDSDGDFSRDWGWVGPFMRARVPYYPKLVVGVPFTPVTGRRILVLRGEDRPAAVRAIVDALLGLAEDEGLSSLQVLFPEAGEMDELERAGLARRVDFQCHWVNAGYRGTDEWLSSLSAKRRHQARREMAAPAAQGIAIRAVRGDELARDPGRWARDVHGAHLATVDKLAWGRRRLNERFYARVFAAMPDAFEVVEATRDGRLVAMAFNGRGPTRLYGRAWGCHEEHPFLHFNVCLYFSIADCITRGLKVFDGGSGGGYKLHRGFDLAPTYSAHAFLDERIDRAMRMVLRSETAQRMKELSAWRQEQRRARGATAKDGNGRAA